MTMSMVGPYLTTIKYNRKQKPSKSKRLAQAQADHEEYLKRLGVGRVTLPVDKKGRRLGINPLPNLKTGPSYTSDVVPSNGNARPVNTYTGDELLGIATMHKSNAVPVRKDSKDAAKEIASMRR
jgi:hypothetical protein